MSPKQATTSMCTALVFACALTATASDTGKFEWTTESAEAKKLIGEIQARVENFQMGTGTAEIAHKLVEADPGFAMGVYYLSAVVPGPDGLAHLEKAVKLAENASDGERRFIEAMYKARANNGANFQEALEPLEALATDYPNERLVPMIIGQIQLGLGNADEARAAFETAQKIGPSSSRARSFLANDDLLRGEYAQARKTFEVIEKELPEGTAPAPIRYGVAFSYLYEGNDEEAINALQTFLGEYRATGASQNFPEVFIWNSIARIHLENGRTKQAMAAYEKGYESVPDSGLPEDQKQIWYGRLKHGRCRTLAKMGRHEEAWTEAQEIHEMIQDGGEAGAPFMPAYHYLVGYLKLEAGDAKKAVEHLQQANPNDPFHKLLLARALEKTGAEEEAHEAYQTILESNNNGLERALAYPEAKKKLAES